MKVETLDELAKFESEPCPSLGSVILRIEQIQRDFTTKIYRFSYSNNFIEQAVSEWQSWNSPTPEIESLFIDLIDAVFKNEVSNDSFDLAVKVLKKYQTESAQISSNEKEIQALKNRIQRMIQLEVAKTPNEKVFFENWI